MPDPAPERLLVVRLGSLGDLVHTLPAVAALRRAHPEMAIDWLVDRVHREFLDLVPILSSVVALEEPSVRGWMAVRRVLKARRYDVALDFQGLLKSAALARFSGARRVIGFGRAALRESAASYLYTEQVDIGPGRHVIDKNMTLASRLGASGPYEFPLDPVSSAVLDRVRAQGMTRFALLNCGAAWPNKRWPPDRFGRLAAWLQERHGLRSIALWGPGEDTLATEIARVSAGAAVAAPATGLRDVVALARAAALMVSGDTGPTHIAGAVGTPIVALFGPTDATRNGPWATGDVVISRYDECECHYQRQCRRTPARWCLGGIHEADVCAAIDARLAGRN